MKWFKKCLSVTLAALTFINSSAVLTSVPLQVFAAKKRTVKVSKMNDMELVTADDCDLPDNTELFEGYVNKAFNIDGITTFSNLAGNRLSGNDKIIYDFLKDKIAKVADGTINSTQFEIPLSSLIGYQEQWTKEELGGINIIENGKLTDAAKNAIQERIACNDKSILNAVMSDFPYELYWFNKTIPHLQGYALSYSFSLDGSYVKLGENSVVAFHLPVDASYAAVNDSGELEQYKTDSSKLSSIPAAVENARSIVAEAANKTDYEKLIYYRRAIRDLTEYNKDALADGFSKTNINPWQMIYVFDGDPDTKVVCEGFSKAFQYLCDETTFSNKHLFSYIVTGTMTGGTGAGPHMWNLVHIGSLGNYLVDVTNAPANNVRFLSGYTTEQNGTYTFDHPNFTGDDDKTYLGGSTSYQFDESTKSTYSLEELTVAEGYGPLTEDDFDNAEDKHTGISTVTKEATCTEPGEKKVVCTWCGETSTEPINAIGHSWNEGEVTKQPSCAEGERTFTCTVCQQTRTEVIAATGDHAWDEGTVTKEPSCIAGEKTYTCTVCKQTKTEPVAATGDHAWDDGVVTKEPSCIAGGEKTYTCTICQQTRTEAIEATGEHSWNEGTVTKAPSCIASGEKTYTCTICQQTRTEAIEATGGGIAGMKAA